MLRARCRESSRVAAAALTFHHPSGWSCRPSVRSCPRCEASYIVGAPPPATAAISRFVTMARPITASPSNCSVASDPASTSAISATVRSQGSISTAPTTEQAEERQWDLPQESPVAETSLQALRM